MVEQIKQDGRVQLRIKTGVDNEGKDIFTTRTYPRIKGDATDESVYYGSKALGELYKGQLTGIFRIQTSELVEY